jgi:hypothetical protein
MPEVRKTDRHKWDIDQYYSRIGLFTNDLDRAVLESMRTVDQDLSAKAGGLLRFAGLMLATDLVFLSADSDAFLRPEGAWGHVGILALLVLAFASFCAYNSMRLTGRYTGSDANSILSEYSTLLKRRNRWAAAGFALAVLGTTMCLAAIAVSKYLSGSSGLLSGL